MAQDESITRFHARKSPSLATLAGALTAAVVPQAGDATIITVGGDGGIGSVTLDNPGDGTNIGGLLASFVAYGASPTVGYDLRLATTTGLTSVYGGPPPAVGRMGIAARSAVTAPGGAVDNRWTFASPAFNADDGAVFGSADNWVPGLFLVPTVLPTRIWGWLQIELGPSGGNYSPRIISFTYNDVASDAVPFAKPVGGFSVATPVPEPSSLGLLGLGLGAAAVARLRRRRRGRRPSPTGDPA